MNISLIIPTLNAAPCIGNLLTEILTQVKKPTEIIIIDSASEDNTVDIAHRLGAKTMVIPRDEFSHGRARNRAAREAQGDILVFMTQDAFPVDSHLLEHLALPLQNDGIAASYGRHVPRVDASPAEQFARRFNYPEAGVVKGAEDVEALGIKTFFMSNVCSALKKELFFEAGMFPETVPLNEDMIMAARLILQGYKVAYVPDACVIHSHDYSLIAQFRRYFSIGSSLKSNSWILTYTRSEGEGLKYLKEALSFVAKQRRYRWIPYVLLESIAKYAGYRVGLVAG